MTSAISSASEDSADADSRLFSASHASSALRASVMRRPEITRSSVSSLLRGSSPSCPAEASVSSTQRELCRESSSVSTLRWRALGRWLRYARRHARITESGSPETLAGMARRSVTRLHVSTQFPPLAATLTWSRYRGSCFARTAHARRTRLATSFPAAQSSWRTSAMDGTEAGVPPGVVRSE